MKLYNDQFVCFLCKMNESEHSLCTELYLLI